MLGVPMAHALVSLASGAVPHHVAVLAREGGRLERDLQVSIVVIVVVHHAGLARLVRVGCRAGWGGNG